MFCTARWHTRVSRTRHWRAFSVSRSTSANIIADGHSGGVSRAYVCTVFGRNAIDPHRNQQSYWQPDNYVRNLGNQERVYRSVSIHLCSNQCSLDENRYPIAKDRPRTCHALKPRFSWGTLEILRIFRISEFISNENGWIINANSDILERSYFLGKPE